MTGSYRGAVLMAVCLNGCVALEPSGADAVPRVLMAKDFGVLADGLSDDGPAIQRLLAAAQALTGPVVMQFPPGKIVRALTAPERYLFRLNETADLTLDGTGCTFLLGPNIRFLSLTRSHRVTVRNLAIDFSPLPFVDGTIAAVNGNTRSFDIHIPPDSAAQALGGPTREDGEQAFFSMLWYQGPYGLLSRHCWVEDVKPGPGAGSVRLFAADSFSAFSDIVPGEWRVSLPVPGIAHRYGPGACLEISDNDTLSLEDVELWSAPWFGFQVCRNQGSVTFRRVHVRPKPGSGRLTSTWRDGFHVKGNSATLLWEDCILEGMNDDAFNISTHSSRVKRLFSPTRIEVQQTFPLGLMPWVVGNTFMAADVGSRSLRGSSRITGVTGWHTDRRIDGQPAASPVVIELAAPVNGLMPGDMVWQPETANPQTTLRRCTLRNSCRLQTPVTLESCDVTALLWFYAEDVEGPFPSGITVRHCILRRGRGNPRLAVSVSGCNERQVGVEAAIHDVLFEANDIWGDFAVIGVDGARLVGNRFLETGATVRLEHCRDLDVQGDANAGQAPSETSESH